MSRVAILLLLVVGCDDPPEPSGAVRGTASDDALWIMTYNVNFERPSEETVAAIAEADADVVFLQETHEEWEGLMRPTLAEKYPHFAMRHADAEGGMAILSRHPITDRGTRPSPSDRGFPAWCVTVSTPAGDLDVVHVHLHPPLDENGRLVIGFFTTGGLRRDELVHHLGCFEDAPDLVVGDFNEGEGEAVRYLGSRGLREAQLAFPPVERTWRWDTSATRLQGRPDHIFYGPALEAKAVHVMQVGASDHHPLRAALSRAVR